jgi:hypothetical protein
MTENMQPKAEEPTGPSPNPAPTAAPNPAAAAGAASAQKPKSFEQSFAEFVAPIINTMVRGTISVVIGAPLQVILVGLCNVFGQVISTLTAVGLLKDVLKLRADCRQAFGTGLDSIEPRLPNPVPPQQPNPNLKSTLMNGAAR